MSKTPKTVAIVGAGIGGLSTAIIMVAQGHAVEVFEASESAGGKMGEIRGEGFRFDYGPSLFTLPELVDGLFEVAGKNPRDYFDYEKLDIITKYFYPDGTVLNAFQDPAQFANEIENKTGEKAERVTSFLKKSARLYELTEQIFLKSSLRKLSSYLNKMAFRAFVNMPFLGIHRTMAGQIADQFSDPRVRQLFNRYATYNGSDPYQAPATLNVIPHLEHNVGAFFPKGGMRKVAEALIQLANDIGVNFNFNSPVDKIIVDEKTAVGILSNSKEFLADIVVSNMDIYPTYRKLMPDQKAPEKILKQPRSSSALVFYWGMKGHFPELETHNIFFSEDYPGEFKSLFKEKTLQDDPTVYIYVSSKKCPEDAPQGHENWFTMINIAHDDGQDWDQIVSEAREKIIVKLSEMIGKNIEPFIVFEQVVDPKSIEKDTSSYLGSLYGSSSNNVMAAFLRHPNFSPDIRNLYFVGGSVHPGGGIPLCILSAKIATGLINDQS